MNVTQWLGVIAFGVAGLVCLTRRRPIWIALGSAHLYFSLDVALHLRHRFKSTATEAMGSLYAEKGPLQMTLFVAALLAGLVIVVLVQRFAKDRTTRIALTTTILSAGLFIMEIVSLHDFDTVLYARVGPVLMIGWMWLVLATVTAACAASQMSGQKNAA